MVRRTMIAAAVLAGMALAGGLSGGSAQALEDPFVEREPHPGASFCTETYTWFTDGSFLAHFHCNDGYTDTQYFSGLP